MGRDSALNKRLFASFLPYQYVLVENKKKKFRYALVTKSLRKSVEDTYLYHGS